jgi:hypothetical protein
MGLFKGTIGGGEMSEIGKAGWLLQGSGWNEEEVHELTAGKMPERMPLKTVMVYWVDQESKRKEPLGILAERRKSERDNNNAIGMLRLARKVFANSEEQAKRILIGDYV